MACRGVLFAITQEQAERLLAARGDDSAVLSIVQDEIEEEWDEAHLCQTDKAWDAIHRCLSDGTLGITQNVLSQCILGGDRLHEGSEYIVSLLKPEQITQLSIALRALDKEWFREAYFKINADDYAIPGQLSESDFEYTWDWFEGVRDFYEKASASDRWSIFTVDQ
jgi:hypothetical protein